MKLEDITENMKYSPMFFQLSGLHLFDTQPGVTKQRSYWPGHVAKQRSVTHTLHTLGVCQNKMVQMQQA
jgi:hypothetical protein